MMIYIYWPYVCYAMAIVLLLWAGWDLFNFAPERHHRERAARLRREQEDLDDL